MSALLPAPLRRELVRLARGDALLAFDFDGTLAPIVDDPSTATLDEPTRMLLAALAARRRCAVLSGRALQDLRPRLAGLPLVALVGNHGLEVDGVPAPEAVRTLVQAWGRDLSQRLAREPGVRVEDKGLSLSVHFRAAPEPARAEASIRAVAEALPGARVFPGHAVVNLVPEGAPDKGAALRGLLAAAHAPAALYVGDDETDESAFALADEFPLVAVRVGPSTRTLARHALADRAGVDALLHALLEGVAQAA
jgi:trehalose 6-phosphate phosphatase